jgi:ArsR family transcriptional regulator, arsenate/arsenite/antimonite-responsive transcriptional repressor
MALLSQDPLSPDELISITRALADPRRYGILMQLAAAGVPMPCSTIRETSEISASTLSHHIQQLEQVGLISIGRQGKCAFLRFERAQYERFLWQLTKDSLPRTEAGSNAQEEAAAEGG